MSYDFSSFPAPLIPAPPNPDFMKLYNFQNIAMEAGTNPENSASTPICPSLHSCSFSCDRCTDPGDVIQCPDWQSWGVSFDDGPSEFTPKILSTLSERNTTATFFVIGSYVIKYPEYLLAVYKAGHQIAIHTWSHRALSSMTTEVVVSELEYTAQAIQRIIGVRPKYFRPPLGDIDSRIRSIAKAMNLIPVQWNVDTKDWSVPDIPVQYAAFESFVKSRAPGTPGGISLQHDISDLAATNAVNYLELLRLSNIKGMSISECLKDPNPYAESKITELKPISVTSAETPSATPIFLPDSGNLAAPLPTNSVLNGGNAVRIRISSIGLVFLIFSLVL